MAADDHTQLDPSTFPTPQALLHWLKPRLPSETVTLWGTTTGTKNVHNLWLELTLRESTLLDATPPICILPCIFVRIVNNFNHEENKKFLLESHQVLSNGVVQPRKMCSLLMRMRAGESAEDAALRAIRQEFGSVLRAEDVKEVVRFVEGTYRKDERKKISREYPGLTTRYVTHVMEARVDGLPMGEFSTAAEEFGDCTEFKDVAMNALRVIRRHWRWTQ